MHCRQARELFSVRLDDELDAESETQLSLHLGRCPECAAGWHSLSLTVRFVRELPSDPPVPAFVGRVLDRVRGFEAGVPLPADEPVLVSSARASAFSSATAGATALLIRIRAFRLPSPALAPVPVAAAFAFGIVLSYGWVHWHATSDAPLASNSSSGTTGSSTASSALRREATSPSEGMAALSSSAPSLVSTPAPPPSPFDDLDLAGLRSERASDVSTPAESPVEVLTPSWVGAGDDSRLATVGASSDGRVRVVF